MGLISLPIMMRYGHDRSVSAGTIVASGALAQVVPPSLVLIVLADQLGRSVGDMYVGALYPAAITILHYAAFILILSIVRPGMLPALPREARDFDGGYGSLIALTLLAVAVFFAASDAVFGGLRHELRIVWSVGLAAMVPLLLCHANRRLSLGLVSPMADAVLTALIPPLALIFAVLGTIFLGIATPTEGGAMGAVGALLIAAAKRRLSGTVLREALSSTVRLSTFVMFILIGARIFGLTFYGVNGNVWVEELLLSLPGEELGFLVFVTILVFILGCFLDFFEIAFIVVPLLAPVALTLGIDPIWFGIILGINLQASFLSPPFGFALFYLRSVAPSAPWTDAVSGRTVPGLSTGEIYRGVVPFLAIQLLVISLVIAFPDLVLHYRDAVPAEAGSIDFGGGADGDGMEFDLPDFGASN